MTYVAAQLNPDLVKDMPSLLAELPNEYLDELIENVEWNASLKGIGRTTINYDVRDLDSVKGHPIGEPYKRIINNTENIQELIYSWPEFAFALFCAAWKRNPEFDEYGWGGETGLIPKWKINIINKYGDTRVGQICTYKSSPQSFDKEYPFLNRNGKIIDLEKPSGGAEELKGFLYRHFINPDGGGWVKWRVKQES